MFGLGGDLIDLDWAQKRYVCDFSGEVDYIEWTYYGPKPIKVYVTGGSTKTVKYGDTI